MESNNSIEELIIRYLQNEIQEDELRVLDAWIHESDANKSHFFELKGPWQTVLAFILEICGDYRNRYGNRCGYESMDKQSFICWRYGI